MPIIDPGKCRVAGCARTAGAGLVVTLRNGKATVVTCAIHRTRIQANPDRWGSQPDPLGGEALPLIRPYGVDPDGSGSYWREPRTP
jgi:hypothetical protein